MHPALTELALRAAKPPGNGTATIWDGSLKHFGMRISSGGTKSFIVLLRSGRRQVIGHYPVISLAQARTKAKQLLAERTLGRFQPKSVTWDVALADFLAAVQRKNRARTYQEYRRSLKRYFAFGSTRLSEITKDDIARKLDRLNDIPSQQAHALTYAKVFFNWAMKRGYVDSNPCSAARARKFAPRSRILSDTELRCIWKATTGTTTFNTIVRLLMLTGQRRGEIAALRSDYISNDTCTLPSYLTKNGRDHTFPIGSQAQQSLASMTNDTGIIFPARGQPNKPFNGWSKSKAALDMSSAVSDWTLHDLRRTFATRLAELRTPPHIIERLLNHVTGQISGVAAIYNRASYMQEMREAVEKWEKYLASVLASEAPQIRAA